MTLDALIMTTGGFIVALPFLGFPRSWDTVLYFIAGVCVIALGVAVRRRGSHLVKPHVPVSNQKKSFVENVPQSATETNETFTSKRGNSQKSHGVHADA